MAKKKAARRGSDASADVHTEDQRVAVDSLLNTVIENVSNKVGRKDIPTGHDDRMFVLAVPSLVLRYVLQNEGWPLSRVYQLVGMEASFKSTFMYEVMRWHRNSGGLNVLMEAETKPSPDMRMAIVNWDEHAIRMEDCNAIEEWQSKLSFFVDEFQKQMKRKDGLGATVPICFGIDSLMGKSSWDTQKKIEKEGHATRHFAHEAQLIKDYMQYIPQRLKEWPFSLLGINHLKPSLDQYGNMVDKYPGGFALKYQCAAVLKLTKLGKIAEKSDRKEAIIAMELLKNTYGAENVTANVKLSLWYQNDAPEGEEPIHRLHGRFEWWEAAILMLADGWGWRDTIKKKYLPKVAEIIDLHEKSGGSLGKLWWSRRLGVPSSDAMSAHDLGVILEQHPDVLGELYGVLNIARRPFFQPGLDFMQQLDDYEHVARQADAAAVQLQRQQELLRRGAS